MWLKAHFMVGCFQEHCWGDGTNSCLCFTQPDRESWDCVSRAAQLQCPHNAILLHPQKSLTCVHGQVLLERSTDILQSSLRVLSFFRM